MNSFTDLGVSDTYLKALAEIGIIDPTEIQIKTIPFLIAKGTDFIGQAQTGTGKTAAFGLPILHKIDPDVNHIQALILSPTRELGQQWYTILSRKALNTIPTAAEEQEEPAIKVSRSSS